MTSPTASFVHHCAQARHQLLLHFHSTPRTGLRAAGAGAVAVAEGLSLGAGNIFPAHFPCRQQQQMTTATATESETCFVSAQALQLTLASPPLTPQHAPIVCRPCCCCCRIWLPWNCNLRQQNRASASNHYNFFVGILFFFCHAAAAALPPIASVLCPRVCRFDAARAVIAIASVWQGFVLSGFWLRRLPTAYLCFKRVQFIFSQLYTNWLSALRVNMFLIVIIFKTSLKCFTFKRTN